jgi:hypothetical protein
MDMRGENPIPGCEDRINVVKIRLFGMVVKSAGR